MTTVFRWLGLALCLALAPAWAVAEDGYDLWLRYRPLAGAAQAQVRAHARAVVLAAPASPTTQAAVAELRRGIGGFTGREPALTSRVAPGALLLVTRAQAPAGLALPWDELGREGYALRRVTLQGVDVTVIAANSDAGLLYGSFAWLRAAQTGADLAKLDQRSTPKVALRMLNHWDNLDRHVERGYAGASLWDSSMRATSTTPAPTRRSASTARC
jgi:alpha-glucuronidase